MVKLAHGMFSLTILLEPGRWGKGKGKFSQQILGLAQDYAGPKGAGPKGQES
jgi:hypothetical protein